MIARVAPALPLARTFSYGVPDRLQGMVKKFMRVTVPFGARTITGYVVDLEEGYGEGLKEIREVLDIVPLADEDLAPLIQWASRYYVAPVGVVLRYVLPASLKIDQYVKVRRATDPGGHPQEQLLARAYRTFGREAVFREFHGGNMVLEDLFTGCPLSPVAATVREGKPGGLTLFAGPVKERLARYLDLVGRHTAQGDNVLVLLPDFKTAGQYLYRALKEEFEGKVHWYGSSVRPKARMETYFRARNEGGLVILGSKSCSFLPAARLGLIIVERPEEEEYRNEEGFRFNAWEVARQRGRMSNVPVVMGSTFPPFELVKEGNEAGVPIVDLPPWSPPRYHEVRVTRRSDAAETPPEVLVESVRASIAAKERVALYTPRKFYGAFIHCLECKGLFLCPRCHGMLSYAKAEDRLVCSRCSGRYPYRETCSQCGSQFIRFSRAGVEYLEEYFKDLFPEAGVFSLTGDTPPRLATTRTELYGRRPAVIVGTQVLSKFYDLKIDRLIIYGWEDMVSASGFRANERLLHIVLNLNDALTPREILWVRAGDRGIGPADFSDPPQFCRSELEKRRLAGFPPFVRLFSVEGTAAQGPGRKRSLDRVMALARKEGVERFLAGPYFPDRGEENWKIVVRLENDGVFSFLRDLSTIPGVRVEADPVDV